MKTMLRTYASALFTIVLIAPVLVAQDYKSGIEWQEPPVVTPGETDDQPPSDAIILFDGTDMSAWEGGEWPVKDGVVYSGKGYVYSKQKFGDIQLHLEWSAPSEVKGSSQGRGNSGCFLMGQYEIQILDSYDNQTYFDGQAASVYKQTPPMVNAMRKPGEWNTYDIFWTAPRFAVNGDVESPAYVTVVHNGILVLNHFELMGPSGYSQAPHYKVHDPVGPIGLQDHGNPVRFRNIWVRELKPAVGKRVSSPYVLSGGKKMSVGEYEQQKENGKFNKAVDQAVKKALEKIRREEAKAAKEAAAQKKQEAEEKKKAEEAKKAAAEKKKQEAEKQKNAEEAKAAKPDGRDEQAQSPEKK